MKKIKRAMRMKLFASLNIVFFAMMTIVNALGAQGYINGASQSQVSKMFPTMITPAGFTFSIWGVMYLLMGISLIIMLVKLKDKAYQKQIEAISPLFWLSCVINTAWIFVFAYQIIWLSAILIVLLLASVFAIVMRLGKLLPKKESITTAAFGLYTGWLAIASVVNFSAFLVSVNFGFWGVEQVFYSVVLATFLIAALAIAKIHKNSFVNLAIAWAFFGILQNISMKSYEYLYGILVVGIAVLLLSSGVNLYNKLWAKK